MFAAPARSRSVTFSSLAASFSSVAPCRYRRCPFWVKTARHGSPSASGGYTTIPDPSSITGRSGCRADSRASPLTQGPPGGRPACRGPAGDRDPRLRAGCVTSVLILVRASAACAIGIPSLPSLSQKRELVILLGLGAPRRIRTFDLPLRRRSVLARERQP